MAVSIEDKFVSKCKSRSNVVANRRNIGECGHRLAVCNASKGWDALQLYDGEPNHYVHSGQWGSD